MVHESKVMQPEFYSILSNARTTSKHTGVDDKTSLKFKFKPTCLILIQVLLASFGDKSRLNWQFPYSCKKSHKTTGIVTLHGISRL